MNFDNCKVPRCRQIESIIWLHFSPVCEKHWDRHCDDDDSFSLYKALGAVRSKSEGRLVAKTGNDTKTNEDGPHTSPKEART